jgi:hypothetical protein
LKITEKNYDVSTGQETFTEREETKSEKDLRLQLEAEGAELAAQLQAKAIARTAILEKLGITAEEASLLLS